MPPNIKETASVIDSLATLNVSDLVHSKFLPLPQQAEASHLRHVASKNVTIRHDTTSQDSRSTKEQLIEDILEDEEHRQLFSIEHVEANLVQDARRKLNSNNVSKPTTQEEADDYWDTSALTEREAMGQDVNDFKEEPINDNAAKVNGDLYCLWHLEQEERKRQDLIASIVEEERLRKMFSVNTIQDALVVDAARREHGSCSGERDAVVHPETDSYWLWEMES
jgi:hypothetical protein